MVHVVARSADLPEGSSLRCTIGAREIAVFRRGGQLYAIDAACPHRQGPLDEGEIEDDFVVVCPWHGRRFDLRDGSSPSGHGRVNCYKVRIEDKNIVIEL